MAGAISSITSMQLLKALKDPVSYGKFILNQDQVNSVSYSVTGQQAIDRNTSKALTAIQSLLKNQIANQRVPIQFVKNDFKREKTDHKEIEKRINDSNSLAVEINRVAEDFRATLFNIGNMREFDIKLQSLLQTDINELLATQRELTLAQSTDEFKGDHIKKISYIQEKMYKTMEKIQHHFVVQQDIKKKEQKQNIVINVGGTPSKAPVAQKQQDQSDQNSTSFLDSLFQYLGIRKLLKGAGALAAGKAAGKMAGNALAKSEKTIAKNSAKFKAFCKKHPWVGKMSRFGQKFGKIGIVSSVITVAAVYGISALDDAEYDSLLGAFSRSLSNISKYIKESWFGEALGFGGSSMKMKDFYNQSYYMTDNSGITGGFNLGDHTTEALGSRVISRTASYTASIAGYGARVAGSYIGASARYIKDFSSYMLGKAWDKTGGAIEKHYQIKSAKFEINNIKKELSTLEKTMEKAERWNSVYWKRAGRIGDPRGTLGRTAGNQYNRWASAVDRQHAAQNRIDRLQRRINSIPNRAKPVFARNEVLKKFSAKIPVFGVVVGGALAVPDVINYFSVDIDTQIKKAMDILERDKNRFSSIEVYYEISRKIIDNMRKARKWWMATIIKSISLSAINVGVGAGTAGVGLVVSIFLTSIADGIFDWFRNKSLGFDFDKIDFENPYTFISQKELADATSVAFLVTNIDAKNIEMKYAQTNIGQLVLTEAAARRSVNNIKAAIDFDPFAVIAKTGGIFGWGQDNVYSNQQQWGKVILTLSSFATNRHFSQVKNIDIDIDTIGGSFNAKDYCNNLLGIIRTDAEKKDALYYPPEVKSNGSLIFPKGNMDNVKLDNIIGEKFNVDYIKNVVCALRLFYTITLIYANNAYSILRLDAKKLSNICRNSKSNCIKEHGHEYNSLSNGFTNLKAIVEFIGLWYAFEQDNGKDVDHEDIKLMEKIAERADGYLSQGINNLINNSIGNKQFNNILINCSIIYLLCSDVFSGKNSNTTVTDILKMMDVKRIHAIFSILRHNSDWDTVVKYYNEHKDRLIEESSNTLINSISVPLSDSISSESGYKLEDVNPVELDVSKVEKSISDNYTNFADSILAEDYFKGAEQSDNYDKKINLAAKITKKILREAGTDISADAAIGLAELALEYARILHERFDNDSDASKHAIGWEKIKGLKLNTVSDIGENYKHILQYLLGNGENKAVVDKLISHQKPSVNMVYTALKDLTWLEEPKGNGHNRRLHQPTVKRLFDGNDAIEEYTKDQAKMNTIRKTRTPAGFFNENGENGGDETAENGTNTSASNATNGPVITTRAQKLVEAINRGAYRDGSHSDCALKVREALDAAGYNNGVGMGHAYTYLDTDASGKNKLEARGFTEIDANTPLLPGDIGVLNATKAHEYGHVQVWNGHQWVSDFFQNPGKDGPYRREATGIAPGQTLRIYRDLGDKPGSTFVSATSIQRSPRAASYNSSVSSQSGRNTYASRGSVGGSASEREQSPVVVVNSGSPVQSDMESDAVKNSDGIADLLFITGRDVDMIFGTMYAI